MRGGAVLCETKPMKRRSFRAGWVLAALLLAPAAAVAETATEAQTRILQDIFKCLAAGLPADWREAEMFVTLKKPGDVNGEVRFTLIRKLSGGQVELFRPCSDRQPARELTVELRKLQPAERRGWTSARLTYQREGKFDLNFEYPPK